MANNGINIGLKSYDDLFKDDIGRRTEEIKPTPISELKPFSDQPFKVVDDDNMTELVESIKLSGILSPIIARPHPEGGYEILSGHRRVRACEIAGIKEVPVVVTFENAPKDNPIKATPSVKTVVVKGPQQIIEKLKSVELEPINFADITPDATEFVQKIRMPDSIESSDGNVEITVNLEMKGITYKNIVVTNSSFKPQNVTQGLTATMDSFTVKVIGPSSALKGITADNIVVSADLKSYSKGEHSGVPVTVKLVNKSSAWVAGVYTADIKQS